MPPDAEALITRIDKAIEALKAAGKI